MQTKVIGSAAGAPLMMRAERADAKMVDMVNKTGVIVPVKVDLHDVERETAWKKEGWLVVSEYETSNPRDPTVTASVWQGLNRVMLSKTRPAVSEIHVRQELLDEMNRRQAACRAEHARYSANLPFNKERQNAENLARIGDAMTTFLTKPQASPAQPPAKDK